MRETACASGVWQESVSQSGLVNICHQSLHPAMTFHSFALPPLKIESLWVCAQSMPSAHAGQYAIYLAAQPRRSAHQGQDIATMVGQNNIKITEHLAQLLVIEAK